MKKAGVVFVFSGQGSQWPGMGVAAHVASPAFRATIARLQAAFPGEVAAQLDAVFRRGEEAHISSGPALTAFQIAATNALREEGGLEPSVVLGYSIGEVAAAYAAGALSESDTFAISLARTAVAWEEAPQGSMAVTGLSEADFRQSKGELQLENVYIACFNSPSNLTVGGPDAELDKLQAAVVAKGGYWKQVETHGKAFHHPKLRGRLSFIEKRLRGELGGGRATLSFASSSTGSVTWISTSTSQGGLINSPGRDAVSYFSASLAEPVQFAHAVAILLPGSTVYEVGPSSGLLRLVTQCRPKLHTAPLVKRHRPDTEASLGSPPPPGSKPAYQTVFVFCGEGAHDSSTDVSLLQSSPAWEEVTQAMREVTNRDLAEFLHAERGSARAPDSILFTTVVNILHAALWRSWGVEPNVAVGHSSGDVAAAHACGMYTTVQALRAAHDLGRIASTQDGGMLYTQVAKETTFPLEGLEVAGINSVVKGDTISVTLCGSHQAIEAWLAKDKRAVRINSATPWHHSSYAHVPEAFLPMASSTASGCCRMVSTTGGGQLIQQSLCQEHWKAWISSKTDLPGALYAVAHTLQMGPTSPPVVVIECGSHPIARSAAQKLLNPKVHVASSHRGASAEAQIREARSALATAGVFADGFASAVKAAFPEIDYNTGFAEQGIDSQQQVSLASELQRMFPGITVPDLYQHTSLAALVGAWDAANPSADQAVPSVHLRTAESGKGAAAMILGVGMELPPDIRDEKGLWDALVREQIAIDASRGAGYLTSFDYKQAGLALGVSKVELEVIDPQHVLALAIVDRMWKDLDAGLRARVLSNRSRVGVYMGVWQTPELPATESAYSVLGCALSALASRIANTYDFQGPAVAVNTACSSSLVAVDMMMKDLRVGRIDYAIVGGVNLIGENKAAPHLRKANFLSPTFRCHTFSSAADGYVRSEGGVCFLVAKDDGVTTCKGLLMGSAVNQNSQRKPMTSVDPEAQARLISAACQDASIDPVQVSAVEMHGTGTRIGDPVEIRALAATMGTAQEGQPCFLTAAKMHFGHLESAAGALGLLKVLVMLQRQEIPAYSVLPSVNPMVAEAMQGSRLALVARSSISLAEDALIGISSFGFTGNNAHIIVKGAGARNPVVLSCTDSTPQHAAGMCSTPQWLQPIAAAPVVQKVLDRPAVPSELLGSKLQIVTTACQELGVDIPPGTDSSTSVIDLGIDSLGIAELASRLGLPGVDSIFADPSLRSIAGLVSVRNPPGTVRPQSTPKPDKPVDQATELPVKSLVQSLQVVITACQELGVDIPPGTDSSTSVIDLGIDSLGIAELASRLGLPGVDSIFADPSLRSIAICVDKSTSGEPRSASVPTDAVLQLPTESLAEGDSAVVSQCCQSCHGTNTVQAAEMAMAMDMSDAMQLVIAACNAVGVPVAKSVSSSLSVLDLGMDCGSISALAARLGLPSPDSIEKNPTLKAIAATVANITPADSDNLKETVGFASLAEDAVEDDPSEAPYEWILTTHVGSLPRKKGANLVDMVELQLEAGIDVINDGEMSRPDYISDVLSRISGVHSRDEAVEMPMAADMNDAPQHSRRFTGINGLITLNKLSPARSKLVCTSHPSYDPNGAAKCTANVMSLVRAAAASGLPASSCFWSVPSPGTIALFCQNQFFGDYTTYVNALAEALRHEYEAIASTGVMLQVDAPCLAMGRHTRFDGLTDTEFLDVIFKTNLLALNRALSNIPASRIRVHICWGNYPGPHTKDIGAELLWPHLVNLKARYILIEMANPRHGADLTALASVASKLGDKVIVPGVVECTNPRVEHPRLIAERLVQLAALVGPVHVMAGTDCGFASTANALAITEDIVWMKIRAMVEGAKIASELLYNANAPATTSLLSNHATARVVLCGDAATWDSMVALRKQLSEHRMVAHTHLVDVDEPDAALEAVQWRIDWPIMAVALCQAALPVVRQILNFINSSGPKNAGNSAVSRRSATHVQVDMSSSPKDQAGQIYGAIRQSCAFDKRRMVASARPLLPDTAPGRVDVVVVGAGLLGLYAATRIAQSGMSVVVLERRHVVGGIWSMYANSTSQVNTSEGAYCVKELLGEDLAVANRDHSSANEILRDLQRLASRLGDKIKLGATVNSVAKQQKGGYVVHITTAAGEAVRVASRGVVMAINDRVGIPRKFTCPGMESSNIQVAPGICDGTSSLSTWRDKRVVVYGMGAFAVEATRTALEAGAAEVVVVARRIGTVCPKIIDYENFVTDWDENFQHDVRINATQMQRWRRLYAASGANPPACWPRKVKPQGHTISVSDIWFVAHHMGKLSTRTAAIVGMEKGAVILDSGERLEADILVPCIGFERNTSLCHQLTGYSEVCASNYLDKHLIYLADAEIDDNAFNSLFGSSVLEYAKFYTNVYIEGLQREAQLGDMLWGPEVPRVDINKRTWSQYITTAHQLFAADPTIKHLARQQVDARTAHFMASLPPPAYEAANRQEWEDIHTLCNSGVPVPRDKQLPYYLDL